MEAIDNIMFVMIENMAVAAIESVISYRFMTMPLQARMMLEGLELMFEEVFIELLKRLL